VCSRIDVPLDEAQFKIAFEAFAGFANWPGGERWPTDAVPVVHVEGDRRVVAAYRWGLIPSWWRLPLGELPNTFNARAETVATLRSFRGPFVSRRCVLPVSGYFEWSPVPGAKRKQKQRISSPSGELLALAGLWDEWVSPDGRVTRSCTIVTTVPNERMAEIHHRMPVVLDRADVDRWLSPASSPEELLQILCPCPAEALLVEPVPAAAASTGVLDLGL
jgi:putative SOS response-associated peptidase YedK